MNKKKITVIMIISLGVILFYFTGNFWAEMQVTNMKVKSLSKTTSGSQENIVAIPMKTAVSPDAEATGIKAASAKKAHYKEGEILVRFKKGVNGQKALKSMSLSRSVEKAGKLTIKKEFRILSRKANKVHAVVKAEGIKATEIVELLKDDPSVEAVSLNYLKQVNVCEGISPDDTFFGLQWPLCNTGQEIYGEFGMPGADIKATKAWKLQTGSADVVVAVLDTGVDYMHPDLINNMWVNPGEISGNGIDDDGNGYITE
ncbi:hypothetical protein GMMP1_1290002 [Candidatus Magnetomoraceae bacterium gMMP-1]